jgi:hypothetical protein
MLFPDTADQRRCLQTLCKTCKSLRLRWPHCPASSVSGHIALLLHSMTDPANITGVYFVLFVLAVWSTYRQTTSAAKKLRLVTVLLYVQPSTLLCCTSPVFVHSFLVLLTHFITRSLEFSRARLQIDTDREMYRWSIPLTFLGK